jgi:hypothetical protein
VSFLEVGPYGPLSFIAKGVTSKEYKITSVFPIIKTYLAHLLKWQLGQSFSIFIASDM